MEKREIDRKLIIPMSGGAPGAPYWQVQTVIEEVTVDAAGTETRIQLGPPIRQNIPTTLQEAEAYIGASAASLAAANQTLTDQNTALQARVADLTQRLTDAVNALDRTRSADRAYEAQVGPTIDAVLVKELGR